MRKIIGNLFMAIDGAVESPEKWSLSYRAACRARTRCCWPGQQGDSPRPGPNHTVEDEAGAGLMITVTKYLVSRTLTKVD